MKQEQEEKKRSLPGFTAKFSLESKRFSYSSRAKNYSYSTGVIPASYSDCPGCKIFCDLCHSCIASNRGSCSAICNKCYACDCPPIHSPLP